MWEAITCPARWPISSISEKVMSIGTPASPNRSWAINLASSFIFFATAGETDGRLPRASLLIPGFS
jgi:hypothetical protein